MGPPELDDEVRARLGRRFGPAIDAWFESLPPVLDELGTRWRIEWGPLVRRGSMSVVVRCRADGRPAVLKLSPERPRLAHEARALATWDASPVPAVFAFDESAGALLLEGIEPGTPLADVPGYPAMERVAALLTALHGAVPPASFPPVADRVARLFDSSLKLYEWKPELVELVSPERYERGRRLALRLAADARPAVLLHGDLTPVNVLDGGDERGLVAIDPAACVGDDAFDAIDVVFWRAPDAGTIAARARELAPAVGADAGRLLDWCTAFAGMTALELAEAGRARDEVEPFLELGAAL